MKIDINRSVEVSQTPRVEMLGSMFEVPTHDKISVSLSGDIPLESKDYNIGLIVGPSGSGKTILLESLFGIPTRYDWKSRSVIDDFPKHVSMETISRVCQSVGFNTIPSWLRPHSVLSNGERFRVEVARSLIDDGNPIVLDEFTSVVDRQVAQYACHAIQKYVREMKKRLVVASCHYDIINWLQPDWILEPGNPCRLTWRSLRRRPPIDVAISRIKYDTWKLFRDFHYMSQDLNKAARCYGLFVRTSAFEGSVRFHTGANETSDKGQCSDADNRSHGAGFGDNPGQDKGHRERNVLGGKVGTDDPGHEEIRTGLYPNSESSRLGSGTPNENEGSLGTAAEGSGAKKENERFDSESSSGLGIRTVKNDIHPQEVRMESNPGSSENVWLGRSREKNANVPNEGYRIASMCGLLYRPHPKVQDIIGFSRMVTLPDFQGLGLALVLANTLGSAYKAMGKRLHSYPNHPAWIRSYQRSKDWMQVKQAGQFSPRAGTSSTIGGFGGRRCAVFMYIGPSMSYEVAKHLTEAE